MSRWTNELEEELVLLIKDWLKNQGRTQAELGRSLQASSTRMPAILEVLQKEHRLGGIPKIIARLCGIEAGWASPERAVSEAGKPLDPFGQLDLLLEEIRDDCEK